MSPCSEAICWSCGCKSHHCNSQFGSVVISDSRCGDSTAESSEVKAFYRGASNQKGRSESERNRRRNIHCCSCQASRGSRRWLLSLWKKLRDTHKEASGGLKAAILERSVEKARKVCEPVRMTLRMTKTVPITEKREMERRFADWRMRSLSEETGMMINLVERGPLDSGETAGTHSLDSVLGYGC